MDLKPQGTGSFPCVLDESLLMALKVPVAFNVLRVNLFSWLSRYGTGSFHCGEGESLKVPVAFTAYRENLSRY
jgi:hypothetical protein